MHDDLDHTVGVGKMIPIIERRAVLVVRAAQQCAQAVRDGEPPEQIKALRREAFAALVRLAESTPQDIRAGLQPDLREEFESILFGAEH
jgi:hypothetical protein